MRTCEGLSPPSAPPSTRDAAQALVTSLQQRARRAGVALREPPPEPSTCCGRGCAGCVWGSDYEAVDYWRQEAESLLQR